LDRFVVTVTILIAIFDVILNKLAWRLSVLEDHLSQHRFSEQLCWESDPDVKAHMKIVNSQAADRDLQDCSVPDHRRDPNVDRLLLFDHGLSAAIAT
jgi:hypothetical protein